MDRLKLASQSLIMLLLVIADALMFYFLVTRVQTMAPEAAALLGSLVTAITGAIGLGAKDFFNPRD